MIFRLKVILIDATLIFIELSCKAFKKVLNRVSIIMLLNNYVRSNFSA